jgi:predicted metal-dependent hydrolase
MQDMPDWVVDYVIVHELAHLIEAGHNDRFWRWVGRYPDAERAKAWLDGYSAAARLEPAGGSAD